jgi:uncharacterized protein
MNRGWGLLTEVTLPGAESSGSISHATPGHRRRAPPAIEKAGGEGREARRHERRPRMGARKAGAGKNGGGKEAAALAAGQPASSPGWIGVFRYTAAFHGRRGQRRGVAPDHRRVRLGAGVFLGAAWTRPISCASPTTSSGERCTALTTVSVTMAQSERKAAVELATGIGVRHEVVESSELERPGFAANPTNRCYHCKAELLEIARPAAERLGMAEVLLGTNLDDLGDHRPGLEAANERGGRHPMVEAGLTKSDIRSLSRQLGLSTWDKPQLACLSSRFPYGTEITDRAPPARGRLRGRPARARLRQLRVRFHGEIARLELEPEAMSRALHAGRAGLHRRAGPAPGFTFVALDLAGFASGSLNQLVGLRRARS